MTAISFATTSTEVKAKLGFLLARVSCLRLIWMNSANPDPLSFPLGRVLHFLLAFGEFQRAAIARSTEECVLNDEARGNFHHS
jgi:hypothetical protein